MQSARRLPQRARLSVLAGVVLPAWSAVGPESATAQVSPAQVPAIPVAQHIEQLDPIQLRRQVSRAEGRISDLEKRRDEALAGLQAAIAEAEARAAAAASSNGNDGGETPSDRTASANAVPARPTPPLLDPGIQADRRRAIEVRYDEKLADARRRLARLLTRQARIDPDAPDQQRLRDAARTGARNP